jgi:hypothetical protein
MGIELHTIDIGEIPPTPTDGRVDATLVKHASDALIDHARKYGFPVAYKQEQNGRLVHNLIPQKEHENEQISGSSKVELEFHTESAFHPYKPSHVHLLCLRGDEKAATTYADIDDILEELTPLTTENLQMPWYETGIDKSFQIGGAADRKMIITPLRKTYKGWELCYDGELTNGINPAATESLKALRRAIQTTQKEIILKTGELLTINNQTTVHGRKPFQARYDGTDRWLQRVLSIIPMPPPSHLDGNIITTEFRA